MKEQKEEEDRFLNSLAQNPNKRKEKDFKAVEDAEGLEERGKPQHKDFELESQQTAKTDWVVVGGGKHLVQGEVENMDTTEKRNALKRRMQQDVEERKSGERAQSMVGKSKLLVLAQEGESESEGEEQDDTKEEEDSEDRKGRSLIEGGEQRRKTDQKMGRIHITDRETNLTEKTKGVVERIQKNEEKARACIHGVGKDDRRDGTSCWRKKQKIEGVRRMEGDFELESQQTAQTDWVVVGGGKHPVQGEVENMDTTEKRNALKRRMQQDVEKGQSGERAQSMVGKSKFLVLAQEGESESEGEEQDDTDEEEDSQEEEKRREENREAKMIKRWGDKYRKAS
ncbi:hypothetical protein FKM82_030776 [Ascaphus truei]